jgi:hypothetical protein
VGDGTQNATLNTAALTSSVSTTLTIASGGTVVSTYASGSTNFNGVMAGGGLFQKAGSGALVLTSGFNAPSLDITLTAGTLQFGDGGTTDIFNIDQLTLAGGTLSLLKSNVTASSVKITGNTVIDFNSSAGTFLSSATLEIGIGVTVTINNWISVANNASQSTVWYVTNTGNGVYYTGGSGSISLPPTQFGTGPLGNIVFTNYNGLTTTWVAPSLGNGWFDKEIRPTPEPSTYGMIFMSGAFGLLGWRRYRAKKQAAKQA